LWYVHFVHSMERTKNWGTLVPRINVENIGWFHLIHKYLRARYPHLKMLDNVIVFVQGTCIKCFNHRLLGNGSLKLILMSTKIQQRFMWIWGIFGSPGVSDTTDTGDQQLLFSPSNFHEFNSFICSRIQKAVQQSNIQLWSVNQVKFVTEQRLASRHWRLYFVCYSYSNL
jgi:hypothetical protein